MILCTPQLLRTLLLLYIGTFAILLYYCCTSDAFSIVLFCKFHPDARYDTVRVRLHSVGKGSRNKVKQWVYNARYNNTHARSIHAIPDFLKAIAYCCTAVLVYLVWYSTYYIILLLLYLIQQYSYSKHRNLLNLTRSLVLAGKKKKNQTAIFRFCLFSMTHSERAMFCWAYIPVPSQRSKRIKSSTMMKILFLPTK